MPQKVGERPSWAERHEDQQKRARVLELDRGRARCAGIMEGSRTHQSCGHDRHIGACPACQRAQLARWSSQLAAVSS